MQHLLLKHESKRGQLTLDWVAVALSVVVLFAPVTWVFQNAGGGEIVDVEQEECSVEIAESVRVERQRREAPTARVTRLAAAQISIKSCAQLHSRITERDSLNGTGSWLRL